MNKGRLEWNEIEGIYADEFAEEIIQERLARYRQRLTEEDAQALINRE
jgi:hypothetical protein